METLQAAHLDIEGYETIRVGKKLWKHTYKRTFNMILTEDGPLEFEEQE